LTLVSSPPVIPNPVARFRRTGVRDLLFPGCPVLASFARVGILPLASSSPPSPHRHFERSRPTFSSPSASCGWVGLRREKSLCGFAVTLPGCPILALFARVGILPLAYVSPALPTPSFRTEQADFLFPSRFLRMGRPAQREISLRFCRHPSRVSHPCVFRKGGNLASRFLRCENFAPP